MRLLSTFLLFLFCLAFPVVLPLSAQSSGQALFEQAYRLENEDPARAAELYRRALARGLDAKLRRTARIRLGIVEKRLGGRTRPAAGSRFDPRAAQASMRKAGVPAGAIDGFFQGYRILRTPGGAQENSSGEPAYMAYWRPALQQASGHLQLRISMVRALVAHGQSRRAFALLDEAPDYSPELGILKADLLLGQGKPRDARDLLLSIASDLKLDEQQKVRLLYLLGRIARERRDFTGAVRYFRLAARYGDRGQQVRYRSLAAYTLYRMEMPLQARGLMRGLPGKSSDRNIRLLDLILRVQVDGEVKAHKELKALAPRMQSAAEAGRASYLERKARELLGSRG